MTSTTARNIRSSSSSCLRWFIVSALAFVHNSNRVGAVVSETFDTCPPLQPLAFASTSDQPRGADTSYKLLNVRIDDIEPGYLMDLIHQAVVQRSRLLVVNANAHLINLAQTRPWLISLFDQAGVAFCDGAGVQLACWLKTGRKPARHTPPEWIEPLAVRLAGAGASVYWLGGKPETVVAAARQLADRTGLRVPVFTTAISIRANTRPTTLLCWRTSSGPSPTFC